MLIKKIYNAHAREEQAWFDSSMIVYTRMVENEFENKGNLFITYNNGATYMYEDVKFEDYVLVVGGGIDISQGKTINKVIKPKYECNRVEDMNLTLIKEELEKLIQEDNEKKNDVSNTYFISGHKDITTEEFEINYTSTLEELAPNQDLKFIISDDEGCSIMCQNYLIDVLQVNPDRITVYCTGETPQNINPKIEKIKSGFKTEEDRNICMTLTSSDDIAFVRDYEIISDVAKNILRRHRFLVLS